MSRKGTRREQQACDIYEAAGFETYRPATVQFGENDVFGLFDHIAVAPDRRPRYVQVKSNRAAGIEDWCEEVTDRMPIGWITAEFLVCHDREGWRMLIPVGDGYTAVVDERGTDEDMGEGLARYLEE